MSQRLSFLFMMAALFLQACASATPAEAEEPSAKVPPSQIPAVLQRIEAKYKQARTFTAKFEQVVESASVKTKKVSSGRLAFAVPSMLRWETLKPDPELLVSNGKVFWHYTPAFDESDPTDKGQVIIRSASKVRTKLLEKLLAGEFSKLGEVSIKQEKDGTFVLSPKTKTARDFKKARLYVDSRVETLERVVVDFPSGNKTDLHLTEVRLGAELSPGEFEFQVPLGAQVIRE